MKKTELVFILDRSGSMSGLEEDTIGGYNSMLSKQKKEVGVAMVTTVLFDDGYEVVHDQVDIKQIKPLTEKQYFVRGSTALLDAIGITISKIIRATKNTDKKDQASKVMFVIITDGMENASSEYSYKKVKSLIDRQSERYNWEFVFLGANIDALETASKFGISSDRAVTYHSDSVGTRLNYQVVNELIADIRMEKKVDINWKQKIEEDFRNRSK